MCFRDNVLNVTPSFLAGDGMLLVSSIEDTELVVGRWWRQGETVAWRLTNKRPILATFNMRDKPREIAEIQVKDMTKCLKVTINDTKNLSEVHKQNMMEKAARMTNLTH